MLKKEKIKKGQIIFILIPVFFLFIIFPLSEIRAQEKEIPLNLKIPGLSKECETELYKNQGRSCVSDLGEYISQFYIWFTRAAAIFAVVMLSFGGYQWIFARGNASQIEKAKTTISGALIGLVLTLGAVVLLQTINPDLVSFKLFVEPLVDKPLFECPTDNDLVAIKDNFPDNNFLTVYEMEDPRVNKDMIKKLDKAAKELKKRGYHLIITSAHRTIRYQTHLYDCYQNFQKTGTCNCPEGCNEAAKPSCSSPHVTGKAIDVCVSKNGDNKLCQMISMDYNYSKKDNPPYGEWQVELQQVMKDSGFFRYCLEWWHFESEVMSLTGCRPGDYVKIK